MADENEDIVTEEPFEVDPADEEPIEEPEGGEEEEEFAIEIEGELAEDEPTLVKTLRQEIRDRDKRLATLEKANTPKIEVGERPTLEDCEWDEDKHADALLAWDARKRASESQEQDAAKAAEQRNVQQQRRFGEYRAAAAALPVKDFDAAEAAVIAALPDSPDRPLQQALLHYTKDPAKLVYALAKHPAKLAAIAAEPDIIKAVLMIADLERNLKVTTRKAPPPPEAETIVRGSAPLSRAATDKVAEKLLAEAQKSGDMDKYRAHMRSKRKAA